MNTTPTTNQQEATIDGVPVSEITSAYPEFQTFVDKYVAVCTEEIDLRNKLNSKVAVRQEFEGILKEYLDKYNASKTVNTTVVNQ